MKFETSQTSEPTSANISFVSRSSKRGPTMLRSFAQHILHWRKMSDWSTPCHVTSIAQIKHGSQTFIKANL